MIRRKLFIATAITASVVMTMPSSALLPTARASDRVAHSRRHSL